jgi:hypothetical protein
MTMRQQVNPLHVHSDILPQEIQPGKRWIG